MIKRKIFLKSIFFLCLIDSSYGQAGYKYQLNQTKLCEAAENIYAACSNDLPTDHNKCQILKDIQSVLATTALLAAASFNVDRTTKIDETETGMAFDEFWKRRQALTAIVHPTRRFNLLKTMHPLYCKKNYTEDGCRVK